MKSARLLAILALAPLLAHAGNYATCVLDNMPEAQNEAAVTAPYQRCRQAYPAGLGEVNQGLGRGFFSSSYSSGAECAMDKTARSASRHGAMLIRAACKRLYDGSLGSWNEFDPGLASQGN